MGSHIPSDKSSGKSGNDNVVVFAKPGFVSAAQLPCDVEPFDEATPEEKQLAQIGADVIASLDKAKEMIVAGELKPESFFMGFVEDANADEPIVSYTLIGANRLEMLGILHEFMGEI